MSLGSEMHSYWFRARPFVARRNVVVGLPLSECSTSTFSRSRESRFEPDVFMKRSILKFIGFYLGIALFLKSNNNHHYINYYRAAKYLIYIYNRVLHTELPLSQQLQPSFVPLSYNVPSALSMG